MWADAFNQAHCPALKAGTGAIGKGKIERRAGRCRVGRRRILRRRLIERGVEQRSDPFERPAPTPIFGGTNAGDLFRSCFGLG